MDRRGRMEVVPENVLVWIRARVVLRRVGEIRESKARTIAENADRVCPFVGAINRRRESLHGQCALERFQTARQFVPIFGRGLILWCTFRRAKITRSVADRSD